MAAKHLLLATLVAGGLVACGDARVPDGATQSALSAVYADPAACRRPIVDDCSFYRECLESERPCGADGYALAFGERMCRVYLDQASEFSPAGQTWLRAVRSCLQNELVPELEARTTCDALEDRAYSSHARCYTRPEHSICDLDAKDRVTLLRVTGSELFTSRSLGQVKEVLAACLKSSSAPLDGP